MTRFERLDPRDWLFDGHPIRGPRWHEIWKQLDWSRAYVDTGPSPAGNLGPYWHVPRTEDDDETWHRLYPKVLQGKWGEIVWAACDEIDRRQRARGLSPEWQPIETAPSDGRSILVIGGRFHEAEKVGADGEWWRSRHAPSTVPTHWMPLPAPPEQEK